jgi:hypothetical protein
MPPLTDTELKWLIINFLTRMVGGLVEFWRTSNYGRGKNVFSNIIFIFTLAKQSLKKISSLKMFWTHFSWFAQACQKMAYFLLKIVFLCHVHFMILSKSYNITILLIFLNTSLYHEQNKLFFMATPPRGRLYL